MKSLILVAVILQLVIIGIKTDGKYQFGDIIEFPRACFEGMPTFSHFAVYVGPESGVNISQGDNDIFHRRDTEGSEEICEFGKLHKIQWNSTHEKKNYLDEEIPAGNRTTDKIKERIEGKKGKCEKYGLITNNCEHLATYVRYGRRISLQEGTRFGCIFPLAKNATDEELKGYEAVLKQLDILQKQNNNTGNDKGLCANDAHKPDRLTGELLACQGNLSACQGEQSAFQGKLLAYQVVLALLCCVLIGLCVWWFVKCFPNAAYSQV